MYTFSQEFKDHVDPGVKKNDAFDIPSRTGSTMLPLQTAVAGQSDTTAKNPQATKSLRANVIVPV